VSSDTQDDEIVWRLLDLFKRMNEGFEKVASEAGLSTAEAGALRRLEKPTSMRTVADAMGCDASYITLLTDRLEAQGLVERVTDDRDRRVKQLVLTAKGRRVRRSLTGRVLATSPALVPLDAVGREQLLELLRQLGDAESPRW
jgi:DNA-binding MarR family transcriptional regulator